MSSNRIAQLLENELAGWTATLITSTTLTGITCDVVAATKTVTRATGSWVSDGIAVGDILTFSGFADSGNNVAYTVATLSALTLTGTTAAAMTSVAGDTGVQAIPATKAVDIGSGRMDQMIVNTAVITVTPYDGTTALWAAISSTAALDFKNSPVKYSTALKLVFSADGNAWVLYMPSV